MSPLCRPRRRRTLPRARRHAEPILRRAIALTRTPSAQVSAAYKRVGPLAREHQSVVAAAIIAVDAELPCHPKFSTTQPPRHLP
jgi:hypothetical protein